MLYYKIACWVAACAVGKVQTDSAGSTDSQEQTLSQAACAVLCKQSRLRPTVQDKVCCLMLLYAGYRHHRSIGLYIIVSGLLVIGGANDLQQLCHQSCRYHFVLCKAWQYQLQQSPVALFANIARLT